MKSLILSLSFSATLLFGLPALAGGGHDHSPKHGGVVREVSHVSYELVARPDSLTFYVDDHFKPVSTQGGSGEAVVYAGSSKTSVKLAPAGENRMVAQGSFKLGLGTRVALTLSLPGQPPVKTTFNLR